MLTLVVLTHFLLKLSAIFFKSSLWVAEERSQDNSLLSKPKWSGYDREPFFWGWTWQWTRFPIAQQSEEVLPPPWKYLYHHLWDIFTPTLEFFLPTPWKFVYQHQTNNIYQTTMSNATKILTTNSDQQTYQYLLTNRPTQQTMLIIRPKNQYWPARQPTKQYWQTNQCTIMASSYSLRQVHQYPPCFPQETRKPEQLMAQNLFS